MSLGQTAGGPFVIYKDEKDLVCSFIVGSCFLFK